MNVALLMIGGLAFLLLAYRLYGRLVGRWLGIDPEQPTPAVSRADGVDFVATRPVVLFGHHFASIAAAGPIVGPTMALLYGYLPVWLWILLGVTLVGAVHDLASLFVSVRSGGRSVAEVARATLGRMGFILYVTFSILLCILVGAAFLRIAVDALTSHYALADLGLEAGQHALRTAEFGGVTHVLTGGIATVSVIIITLVAPLIGWLLYRRSLPPLWGTALALAVCTVSFWIGFRFPITVDPQSTTALNWILGILLVYCLAAAWVPVWLVLQPRDFVNVHILYVGLAAMVAGLIGAGLKGVEVSGPALNLAAAQARPQLGMVWPFLFVTIACGACSGAHALICGGTSCKQLGSERHASIIGYGAMLLEGLLALCVTLMLLGPLGFSDYHRLTWEAGGNPVRAFTLAVGRTLHVGLGLPISAGTIFGIVLLEGFVLTTTDTILRLVRYLLQELWEVLLPHPPAWLLHRGLNSINAVALTAALAFSNSYTMIWGVFGSANQLLAGLTLIAITAWLVQRHRRAAFAAIPALFMVATTVTALCLLFVRYWKARNVALGIADGVLLVLSLGVLWLVGRFFRDLARTGTPR